MGVSEDVFYDPCLVAILPMGFCLPGRGRSGDMALSDTVSMNPRFTPDSVDTYAVQLVVSDQLAGVN
jgi:hypothetical protein